VTRWWRSHSVRVQLTLWYVAAMIIVLGVYAAAILVYVNRSASAALNQQLRGDFQFVVSETPSNLPAVLANCVDTQTDHSGAAIARIRVPANATTQLATLRLTDLGTGAQVDEIFTIVQGSIVGTLTVLPNSAPLISTATGLERSVFVPSPSCPTRLKPQAKTVPPKVSATVW